MKIKIPNDLLTIDILTILLILAVHFISSDVVRIIIGLPFLLFFPGYVLVAAIFIKKELDAIEQVAISCGMSFAIVALIGLGLNYTSWGIRLEPALYSVATFTILISEIALIRRALLYKRVKFIIEFKIGLPRWESIIYNRPLSILLIVLILGASGLFGYKLATTNIREKFSEFYILGFNGKAQDYPTDFLMENGQVTNVSYGNDVYDATSEWGRVTLGIVNHEQEKVTYTVLIKIDKELIKIYYNGTDIGSLIKVELYQGERWEQEIGFMPKHIGNNQRVEFFLFKNDDTTAEDSLHIWINVREAE